MLARGGARAIGFVDFDSVGFSDGAGGRGNVVGSTALAELAVNPLIDTTVDNSRPGLPLLTSYRVDPLSSELAGTGVPLAAEGGVVRTVPAVTRAIDLADGAIVNVTPFAADAAPAVVPGLALRLAELGTGAMLSDPTPDGVSLGERRVPLEEGALRVRWSTELDGLDDVQVIDFDELPAGGLVSTALFEDTVVLVGTVDPGATRYVDTPVGRMPEVLVHANALNTLLAGETITVASGGWSTVVTIAAAAAVVLAAGRRRWLAWLVAVAIAAGWLLIVRTRADGGELLPPLGVPVAALGAALLTEVIAQVSALSERRRLRSLFARYVPPTVAQQLVASGRGTAASEGERVAVTVLFCDLRGFTPMAGLLEPTKIRELLNRYYEAMSVGWSAIAAPSCSTPATRCSPCPAHPSRWIASPTPHSNVPARCSRCSPRSTPTWPSCACLTSTSGSFDSGDVVAAHVGCRSASSTRWSATRSTSPTVTAASPPLARSCCRASRRPCSTTRPRRRPDR